MKLSELRKYYKDESFGDLKKHLALLCVRYGIAEVKEFTEKTLNELVDD